MAGSKMSMQIEEKLQNEEISLAPFTKRVLAYSVDELIVTFLFLIIYWDAFAAITTYDDARNLSINFFWQIFALKVIYHAFFVWYYGASPGQMITKTMCINVEILDKPNLTQSLVRAIFRIVSEACFYLGFAWALSNPARQTWQDKIAKTVVINA
ncbi:RDD family protein [Campylobacter concisus]